MKTAPFKICSTCSKRWETLGNFLSDPELELSGYQVDFRNLEGGLFYFTHLHPDCFTTLAIPVKEFTGLTSRPILSQRGTSPDDCIGLCARRGEIGPCPVKCECSWVREIMQIIRNWKKTAA